MEKWVAKRLRKKFLESILKQKINKIDLSKNPILRREFSDDKLGILDILAEIDEKENCNIELQIVDKKNIVERLLYYWSKIYSRQIKSGDDYKILERVIVILIADFELEGLESLQYHTKWKIIEEENRKIILTEKFEIDIIELPKIEGKEKDRDELLDWLCFLENPKSERVTKKMEENEELKEAVEKLDTLSEDERMQKIADLRQKAIMDEKAVYDKGLDDGEKRGREAGKIEGKSEDAKKMIEKNIPIETIIEITGLTKEEIINLNK